jgi:phospholipase C
MASNFATSDRWFAPVMSRTQINRMYMLSGTSQGYVYPIGSNAQDNKDLSAKTIFEQLQNAGITWKIYVNPAGTSDANGTPCSSVTPIGPCLERSSYINMFAYSGTILADPNLYQNIVPISQFTTDVANGTLPQFAYIEPASNAGLDEHPSDLDKFPVNVQDGANYAAGLVNELMNSPSWKDSAMIFTYDEAGGYYEHVPPQPVPSPDGIKPVDLQASLNDICAPGTSTAGGKMCDFTFTGYRVPMIVISPFAKKNFVSHVVRDYTAVLNLVEERFGVPALTARDGYWSTTTPLATMDEFFDFVNVPWATPPSPPTQNRGGTCSLVAPTP